MQAGNAGFTIFMFCDFRRMGAPQARYGESGGIQNGKALNGSGRGEFRLAGEGGPLFVGFQLNGSSVAGGIGPGCRCPPGRSVPEGPDKKSGVLPPV